MTDTIIQGVSTVWFARSDTTLSSTTTSVLSPDFTLYFPYTASANEIVTPTALVSSLNRGDGTANSGIPLFGRQGQASPSTINTAATTIPSVEETFYVPVITVSLPPTVIAPSYQAKLQVPAAASGSQQTSSISSTSPAATSTTTPFSSQSTQISAGSASTSNSHSDTSSPPPSAAAVATSTSVDTNSTTNNNTASGISTGGLVGGTVGGFLGGILLCALVALLCIRRRRNGRKYVQHAPDSPTNGVRPRDAVLGEKHAVIVGGADVTGWRKHLPQEKSTDKIAGSFKTIFEQARLYVECFYEGDAIESSAEHAQHLQSVAPEELVDVLSHARSATPVQEAILTRWIVQGVSLRSDPNNSLLPLEYTSVPQKSHWHMEHDTHERPPHMTAESKKGFPQALSEWRSLTAFLYPNPQSDALFQHRLDHNISEAVEKFAQAYLPWLTPGQDPAKRDESLRRVLRQASDAGVQLFQQPSTFMFDWQGGKATVEGTITVAPALVRRLDEHGESSRPAEVLIEARRVRI